MNRAVFLDRDGVINRAIFRDNMPHPPSNVTEFEFLPGVYQACWALRTAGYLLIVVTNQPDVARGTQSREQVEIMNTLVRRELPVQDVLVCYHDGPDGCDCRKPKPGLLLQAAARWNIDLRRSFMVGDRWCDVKAGQTAGCTTILIDRPYSQRKCCQPDWIAQDLLTATALILYEGDSMKTLSDLKVKIFADGADKAGMLEMYRNPLIRGFTTNPTLMRQAGVTDYRAFALDILRAIPDRPISFEVFSDEFTEMECQAREIATWGENVYVKIPVTNTRGKSSVELIRKLAEAGIKVNVTAMMTLDQVREVSAVLAGGPPSFVSVFAGRIADTGRDPIPLMAAAVAMLRSYPNVELIWASPRELLNIFQADAIGCHIITVTNDILKKLDLVGKDLHEFSLDTVKMFRDDAVKAGYIL